jgi:hypothetical protein
LPVLLSQALTRGWNATLATCQAGSREHRPIVSAVTPKSFRQPPIRITPRQASRRIVQHATPPRPGRAPDLTTIQTLASP